jgi:YebC/PmpR family DNA-binding regulatory protein
MSGHSKWSSIKHKKAAVDAKRGKIFSRIAKEITVAVKLGGGDPDANSRLRLVMEKAKDANMPGDNIKRAVQKGTGELPGETYDELTYEGYGPEGVAIFIETMTNNKNRTVGELRHLLTKHGGSLGENGCVGWMFEKNGLILIDKQNIDEEKLMDIALEAGAKDMTSDPDDDSYEVTTEPVDFEAVRKAIEDAGIEISVAEISMLPQNTVDLDEKGAVKVLKLMDMIEDQEDVQNVYSNFDISKEIFDRLAGE